MVDDNNKPTSGFTPPSSQPVGNVTVSPIPIEPHPEPIVPTATTTDVVKEPAIRVDEILGNSSTIVPANSASQEVPSHEIPSATDKKPKKKNMAGIIVGLFLFLGVVATGAYFVAKPDSLADLRSQAGCDDCKTAKDFQKFYQEKNKEAREKKEAEEPKEEKQELSCFDKCRKESGTEACNNECGTNVIPGMPKKEEVPAENGKCPAGSYTCGSGANMFCSTDQTKTCNQLIIERGGSVNVGSVECNDNGTPKGTYKEGTSLNANGTAVDDQSIGAIKATEAKAIGDRTFNEGDVISVKYQVWEQCATLKNKIDDANNRNNTETKISNLGFGTDKYICKEGVKGEGNIVYSGGACTALNGKKFTGDEKGCFCGTVQVDTGSGHQSYTSTCGCDKNKDETASVSESVSEPTPTLPASSSPICTNIKVYKEAVQITPSTLLPSDDVTIAVVGTGNPTQARFRINGEQITGDTDADPNWTISTAQNASGEYFVSYTIPTGVTSFLFEGETFAQGAWH